MPRMVHGVCATKRRLERTVQEYLKFGKLLTMGFTNIDQIYIRQSNEPYIMDVEKQDDIVEAENQKPAEWDKLMKRSLQKLMNKK